MEVPHLRDLGVDDISFVHQLQTNSFDEFDELCALALLDANGEDLSALPLLAANGEDLQHSTNQDLSLKRSSQINPFTTERPIKQIKSDIPKSHKMWSIPNPQDHLSNFTSFANSNYVNEAGFVKHKLETMPTSTFPHDILASQCSFGTQNQVLKAYQRAKRISGTTARLSHTPDHIIAERKRREKLSQGFTALSAIVPGLKKMDKASVLGDAIKYLKQLQEQVKTLEEQIKRKDVGAVPYAKKTLLASDENTSKEEKFSGSPFGDQLPEIEARFSGRNVLVRIHCERNNWVLEKVIAKLENLHLKVINSSAITFGSSALDVTILSQMDVEFSMMAKDLVNHLHAALKQSCEKGYSAFVSGGLSNNVVGKCGEWGIYTNSVSPPMRFEPINYQTPSIEIPPCWHSCLQH
ncbi:hypothetical protein Nepgr_004897 [Nepenthes gracilis]|uniref:BHLH domain-containing protein n=1 Tax=Nepenthes gracilis TaxID=150966 RepID=A0AAD3XFP8_NEPGR|nr:hypothetical protein Nepgr_004897 [Nepenthes gracilis]